MFCRSRIRVNNIYNIEVNENVLSEWSVSFRLNKTVLTPSLPLEMNHRLATELFHDGTLDAINGRRHNDAGAASSRRSARNETSNMESHS